MLRNLSVFTRLAAIIVTGIVITIAGVWHNESRAMISGVILIGIGAGVYWVFWKVSRIDFDPK